VKEIFFNPLDGEIKMEIGQVTISKYNNKIVLEVKIIDDNKNISVKSILLNQAQIDLANELTEDEYKRLTYYHPIVRATIVE
jgi:hypothetical protein